MRDAVILAVSDYLIAECIFSAVNHNRVPLVVMDDLRIALTVSV